VKTSKDKAETKKNITRHLEQTQLPVRVNLGTTHITISDLLNLEKGDVLMLDNTIEDKLPIYIDNRLKFYGHPGLSNDHVAVKIVESAEEEFKSGE
jgi:flagellar motor switch protein FliM